MRLTFRYMERQLVADGETRNLKVNHIYETGAPNLHRQLRTLPEALAGLS